MIFFRIKLNQLKIYNINDNQSYYDICLKIANFLKASLYIRKCINKNKEFYQYIIIAYNKQSNTNIYNYFNKYPMLSYKYLKFED